MARLVKVGKRGRIVIPKEIRDALNIREGSFVRIYVEGSRIVIEPAEDVVEKFKGSVSVERWPEDLDDFLLEASRDWLKDAPM